jgi:hypothetical protein
LTWAEEMWAEWEELPSPVERRPSEPKLDESLDDEAEAWAEAAARVRMLQELMATPPPSPKRSKPKRKKKWFRPYAKAAYLRDELVDERIKIKREDGDNSYHKGVVTMVVTMWRWPGRFDRQGGRVYHMVEYDDGVVKWHELDTEGRAWKVRE